MSNEPRTISIRRARRGFTLVELVLAIGVLGLVLVTLIDLRLSAVERVTRVVAARDLRRLAQETLEQRLAEFLSDEMQEITGTFPDRPGWTWEWIDPLDPLNVIREGEEFLLACTVKIRYPDPNDPKGPEQEFELTTWIIPTEDQLDYLKEQQALIEESGEYGTGAYGTGAYGADPYGTNGGAYAQ